MRLLLLLLLMGACANTPAPTQEEVPITEPVQEQIKPEPVEPPPKRKPVTVIIQHKTEQAQICAPIATDERKRILQALDCLLESKKPAKP